MRAILLAGGAGTRLWPLSRSHFPKQFLRFGDAFSFFQKTMKRHLMEMRAGDIYIVTSSLYEFEVRRQLEEIDSELIRNIILEPSAKNTAPAIAYALEVMQPDPDEMILVAPADHLITPDSLFWNYIHQAEKWVERDFLVTFSIPPSRPETGFGYIFAEGPYVKAFVEKPSLERAQKFLESGRYYWNSGLFAFSFNIFKSEMEKHCPEIAKNPFEKMPSISLDYALMEKSERIVTIPLEGIIWSDIGSWENVYEICEKDSFGNATQGDVVALETNNSLVISNQKLVVTLGVENLCIVETSDALLVANKSKGQEIKNLVEHLKQLGRAEVDHHTCVHRPWGSYTVLLEGERYKIKKIHIFSQQKLSLQMHFHRSEHWVIVAGTAKVTINSKETYVHEGESVYVPKSAVHRVENPGKVPLEIIEVQEGEYLEEDDIVRLEDIYGRINEKEAFALLNKN